MKIEELYAEYYNLLNSSEYISKKKYDQLILECKKELSDNNIDNISDNNIKTFIEMINQNKAYLLVDDHNKKYLNRMYIKYKDYFENMYTGIDDNIKLDEEQVKAILADEDYSLIIAGAGTGKTTTMTSKVKYLVDIKGVDPSRILVMSYTKKATMELEERIVDKFNIPCCVTTFHSLGYKYIKKLFKKKCIIIDTNERNKIFLEYFRNLFLDKKQIKELIELFTDVSTKKWFFSNYFINNYELYNTYEEFFESYKKLKIEEAYDSGIEELIEKQIEEYINLDNPMTIKGEVVRSVSEAKIANYLFTHGIDYIYEKVYEEVMDDDAIYKPDFTLDLAGENVYIEYFGLDNYKYNRRKKQKEEYHKEHNNLFISLDRIPLDKIEEELDKELKKLGFVYRMRTDEEIYSQLLDNNALSQLYPFENLIYECIDSIKESINREKNNIIISEYINDLDDYSKKARTREYHYIREFYSFYQNQLYGYDDYKFDYADLLYYATKYMDEITNNKGLEFDYIIIDEYQDISKQRYDLAKKTADRNNSKVYAVGDDWQSIYAFSGSRIDYIYRFNDYFKSSKMFHITKTYRNSQELIDTSGEFIMKNKSQIEKELTSNKHIYDPIKFVEFDRTEFVDNSEYDGERFSGYQEYICLEKLILEIHKEHPEHKILVLGRRNKIIKNCFRNNKFKDDIGTKISIVGYDDIELEGMTMHKSKGLTFDEVIIIGLNRRFPMEDYSKYWLIDLFKNPTLEEQIPYAEERRLFYVALTRTKNNVYLLVDKNKNYRSPFIDEIEEIIKENKHH